MKKKGSNILNEELNKLPIHKKLQKLNLNDVMMDFDATLLHPSAMWGQNSVYPKIETGFAFEPHMNNVYVEAFTNQTFNQDLTILRKNITNRQIL